MDYTEALDFFASLQRFGIRLRLDHIRRLLALSGDPHKRLSCIVVGGTNGKGSVSAMLSSVLHQAGYKTGLYISPEILSFTERMRIGGKEISKKRVAEYVENFAPVVEKVSGEMGPPTHFEVVTAMALKYFADEKVDYCVLEVGMGGRLDATNVVEPMLSVITSIGLDHTEFLGETIEKVAAEKAGIIHKGRPVVCGELDASARRVMENKAREMESPVYFVGADVSYKTKSISSKKTVLDYAGLSLTLKNVAVPLAGEFQASNIATALCALEVLMRGGVELSEKAMRTGLLKTKWPGRFEVVGIRPVVVLDGAHNPPAFKIIADSLKRIFPKKRVVLVLSVLDYKDVDGILLEAKSVSSTLVATQSSHPRALSAGKLAAAAKSCRFKVHVEMNPKKAVAAAKKLAGSSGVVCACGSLYLVGDIKRFLSKK